MRLDRFIVILFLIGWMGQREALDLEPAPGWPSLGFNQVMAPGVAGARKRFTSVPEQRPLGVDLRSRTSAGLATVVRVRPPLTRAEDWGDEDLSERTVPVPAADTLSHRHFGEGRFGECVGEDGAVRRFNPEMVLVKFRNREHVRVLRVGEAEEWAAMERLRLRSDVEFAELDLLEERQFTPNDPRLSMQWHHEVINSGGAWDLSLGSASVQIAIVDTPFQMDHPDLAANTVPGWDLILNEPVSSGNGIAHSTLTAGMAAAVVNNRIGVAGVSNCRILPINIDGYISEMYDAVIWAADHGVRVVNISWDGAQSATLNRAGEYLQARVRGWLVMAGVNKAGLLDYPNHPYLLAVSMTDAADNAVSAHGSHIDFAAPGWDIFATSISSSYESESGTSYSAPLVAGVLAVLFSINPALGPDQAVEILKGTAVDKGEAGWDPFYGWGRIDFGAAAAAAQAALPRILSFSRGGDSFTLAIQARLGSAVTLWRSTTPAPENFLMVTNSVLDREEAQWFLSDPDPPAGQAFYRVEYK